MDLVEAFWTGMVNGLGMVIIMTVFSALTFFFLKPWIIKTVTEMWKQVKEAKMIEIKLDGKPDFSSLDEQGKMMITKYEEQMKQLGMDVTNANKNQRER